MSHSKTPSPQPSGPVADPTRRDLLKIMRGKHGRLSKAGPAVRWRVRLGYAFPDEYYEAIVEQLVTSETSWLDVGCGRNTFPHNEALAARLSKRCRFLQGVEPDATGLQNPYVHALTNGTIESFETDHSFDLITLRMVAEHLTDPDTCVQKLARLTTPGGRVVVLTVNRNTPIALLAWITPMWFHHIAKRWLWNVDERDTFPVAYRMNTKKELRALFTRHGFREVYFKKIADCATTVNLGLAHKVEVSLCTAIEALGVSYPENCLLGVYQRIETED